MSTCTALPRSPAAAEVGGGPRRLGVDPDNFFLTRHVLFLNHPRYLSQACAPHQPEKWNYPRDDPTGGRSVAAAAARVVVDADVAPGGV